MQNGKVEASYENVIGTVITFSADKRVVISADSVKRFDNTTPGRRLFIRYIDDNPPKTPRGKYFLLGAYAEGRDIVECVQRVAGATEIYRQYESKECPVRDNIDSETAKKFILGMLVAKTSK